MSTFGDYTTPQNKDPLLDEASPHSQLSPLTCDAPDLHSGLMISTLPESPLTHNTPDLDSGHNPLLESPLTRNTSDSTVVPAHYLSFNPLPLQGLMVHPPSLSPPPRIRTFLLPRRIHENANINVSPLKYIRLKEPPEVTAHRTLWESNYCVKGDFVHACVLHIYHVFVWI